MKIGTKKFMLVAMVLSALALSLPPSSAAQDETAGYSTYHDGEITIPGSGSTKVIGQLFLPAGRYVILAKMELDNESSEIVYVECKLQAGGDFDRGAIRLRPTSTSSPNTDLGMMPLQVVHYFSGGTNIIELTGVVQQVAATVRVRKIKLTAIKVGSLSNVPF